MENIEIPNEEYESQFFEFCPSDVYEGIRKVFENRVEEAINKLDIYMMKIPPKLLSEENRIEGINKLRDDNKENLEKLLLKFKKHLQDNILKIPSNMLLPEDSAHAEYCPVRENEIKKEIDDLKKQIKEEKYMEAVLREELKEIEVVCESQNKFLEEVSKQHGQLDKTKENLNFLLENVKKSLPVAESILENNSNINDYLKSSFESELFQ